MSLTSDEATQVQPEQYRDETPETQPDQEDPAEELPLDQVFDILRSERRRLALRYLLTASEGTTLSDLAEHIAAIENDKPESAITSKERKRVYVGLYQCHLPRMDDADVIEFDRDRKNVELGPNVGQLEPYLEVRADDDDDARNWAPYYLVTSLLGGVLLLTQALLFPLAWLSTIVIDGLILAYFSLSLAHVREDGFSLRGLIGRTPSS